MIDVRCDKCGKLLGQFEHAAGEIKCPRCKHVQKMQVK